MVGTYAAVIAVCGASLTIGQAAIGLCGVRRWSWLSPAVGLALVCAVCWGTVRLPGGGLASALLVVLLGAAAIASLRGRLEGGEEALRAGWPVAVLALLATALPFVAEGHFGILGTGFNPDMSQHLLAADSLAGDHGSQLLSQGYPLGPHAVVVALNEGLGIGLVQGFTGLTVAVAAIASLTVLTAVRDEPPLIRIPAALVVGLTYMVASYFAQGSFKETMQALFFLAFVLALRETSRNPEWRQLPLRFVPAAILAAGSVYTYSFPGLIWPIGAATIWAIAEYARGRFVSSAGAVGVGVSGAARRPVSRPGHDRGEDAAPGEKPSAKPDTPTPTAGPAVVRSVLLASLVFLILIAPEINRMIDFQRFETFDPNGPGLGNLFGQISPFEALGIWPSGDFRLSPGDGAVPALGYHLGAAFASILLLYGAVLCWRRRETALLAGLATAVLVYAAARLGGTPYTGAKAIAIGAPIAALVIVLPLLRRPVAWLYLLVAGGSSLLALANAPVGPTSYTPVLTGLRAEVGEGPTLVLASRQLLEDEHGTPYVAWELRGGRVCIELSDEAGSSLPAGVRFVVAESSPGQPPFPGLKLRRIADPYVLWERRASSRGRSSCPLVAVRQARQGPPR
ncbi:MAG TPA: hypothetical protein VN752_00330 [Solirubrobacterales bacterium]|nr:hypothetical protein [Solirubrobacterales bacterium]